MSGPGVPALPFRLGYNTNGLPFHRLPEALELVAGAGFHAVAITPDVGALDPFRLSRQDVVETASRLSDLGLRCAIEAGARFVLDPERKHRPNLLDGSDQGRERRIDFYRRCIDLAADLGAGVMSLWAGAAPEGMAMTLDGDPASPLGERLAAGLATVVEHARAAGVRVGFEPEPGMFVERPAGFETLLRVMGSSGDDLGLTLDVGHCVVTGDLPVSDVARRFQDRLIHVHLADCPPGVHEHLPLGHGGLDLRDALDGLCAIGFDGIAAVELSRDGHRGPDAVRESWATIQACR